MRSRMMIVLCLVLCGVPAALWADLGGVSQVCALQADDAVVMTFQIPSGLAHEARLTFEFRDNASNLLEIDPTATANPISISVDPPSYDAQTFTDFYAADELNFNPLQSDVGYFARLQDLAGPTYRIDILIKEVDVGSWAADEDFTVTISGLANHLGVVYKITASLADESGATVTNLVFKDDETPYVSGVLPCNRKPVAAFTVSVDSVLDPGGGPIFPSADGSELRVQGPVALEFDPASSSDPDGDGIDDYTMNLQLGDGGESEATNTARNGSYGNVDSYPVTLTVTDDHGNVSDTLTKTVLVMPQDTVHFPRHLGVPFENDPPAINGVIETDVGWRGAYKSRSNNGTSDDIIFNAIRNNSAQEIYLGIQAFPDSLGPNDRVVIGIRGGSDDRASTAPAVLDSDRIIIINPNGTPSLRWRKRDGAGAWETTSNPLPTGIVDPSALPEADIAVAGDGTGWALELRLPTDEITADGWEPIADDFAFFFAVVDDLGAGATSVRGWPDSADSIYATLANLDVDAHDFEVAWWGRANKTDGAASSGLSLAVQDVGAAVDPTIIQDADLSDIDPATTLNRRIQFTLPAADNEYRNILVAKVRNNWNQRVENGGTGAIEQDWLEATDVYVTFRVANWGLPSGYADWGLVNSDLPYQDGTSPSNTVPPFDQGGVRGFGVAWTLDLDAVEKYSESAVAPESGLPTYHQCMLVEIHSNSNVDIVTKSVYRNMDFREHTTSPFSHQAIISALGYPTEPGQTEQKFLLRVSQRHWDVAARDDVVVEALEEKPSVREAAEASETSHYAEVPYLSQILGDIVEADGRLYYVEYVVKGYRFTGGHVTVDGVVSDMVSPVGSYGYVIRHDGPVEEWELSLEGPGVEQIDETTYIITIPAESSATVIDTIAPLEPPRLRVHAMSGLAIPVGALAGSYGIGPNVIAGAGYFWKPEISFHGLLGYNLLLGAGGGPNGTLMSVSLAGRYHYGLTNAASVYGGLGVGYYFGDALANPEVGMSGGVGWTLRLMRLLELEAGLDYHYLPGSASQYLHGHAGASLRF